MGKASVTLQKRHQRLSKYTLTNAPQPGDAVGDEEGYLRLHPHRTRLER